MLSFVFFVFGTAAWAALYLVVISPRLESFRLTTGIYAEINARQHSFWKRAALRLEGAKVALIGLMTSSVPIVVPAIGQVYGLDWAQFFPADKAPLYGLIFSLVGIVGPMIMTALHSTALDAAAKIEPIKD